jgi:putative ABC transport system permease protein
MSVAAGILLIVAITNIKDQINNHFYSVASRCELVVGAKGSPLQLVLNSVYFMSVPTGNISYSYFDSLKEDPLIQMMIPLSMGDHYKNSMIVGTTDDFFTENNPLITEKLSFYKGEKFDNIMQAVLGYKAAQEYNLKPGDELVAAHGFKESVEAECHDHLPYTVTGILNPTNTPVDRTIFVDIRSVWYIHEHHDDHDHHHNNDNYLNHKDEKLLKRDTSENTEISDNTSEKHEKQLLSKIEDLPFTDKALTANDNGIEDISLEELIKDTQKIRKEQLRSRYALVKYDDLHHKQITSILIKLASPSYLLEIQRNINENTPYQAAMPAYEIQKLISYMGNVDQVLLIVSYIVIVVALFSIIVLMYGVVSNRIREIAIMRALGASKRWLVTMIIIEVLFICFSGWLLGIIFGHLLIYLLSPVITDFSGVYINAFKINAFEAVLLPVILILGGFSGLIPAIKVYKADVAKYLSLKI